MVKLPFIPKGKKWREFRFEIIEFFSMGNLFLKEVPNSPSLSEEESYDFHLWHNFHDTTLQFHSGSSTKEL